MHFLILLSKGTDGERVQPHSFHPNLDQFFRRRNGERNIIFPKRRRIPQLRIARLKKNTLHPVEVHPPDIRTVNVTVFFVQRNTTRADKYPKVQPTDSPPSTTCNGASICVPACAVITRWDRDV